MEDHQSLIINAVSEREVMIRRIARHYLRGHLKTAYDSDDLVSSITRRLLEMEERGRLRLETEAEITRLIQRMSQNQAIDRIRLERNINTISIEDPTLADDLQNQLQDTLSAQEATDIILMMSASLQSPIDQQLLWLRLHGFTLRTAAAEIGLTVSAAKKRWQRAKELLHARYGKK